MFLRAIIILCTLFHFSSCKINSANVDDVSNGGRSGTVSPADVAYRVEFISADEDRPICSGTAVETE